MGRQYIHYGADHFEKERFAPIKNRMLFAKPFGGFWASDIHAKFGWKEWCARSGYADTSKQTSFQFVLSDSAKVLEIKSVEDLTLLPRCEDSSQFLSDCGISDQYLSVYPDFELLRKQGCDAIEATISNDPGLYHKLYGWDCDSILILNPDIVIEVTDNQKERTAS